MKIVVLDGYTLNPGDISWDPIEKWGDMTCHDRTPDEKIVERIGDAQIILTNKTPLSRQTLQQCPKLRYIGVLATGYNIIDVDAAAEQGITVTNVPGYSTQAVAQFTMALLLEFCHHVQRHSDSVMAGDWIRSQDFSYWNYPMNELSGKTIGLVGYGQIGRQVARLAQAFDMQVLASRQSKKPDEEGLATVVDFEKVLSQSDIISLHCPQTKTTTGIINAKAIRSMKDGVYLINTARGGLVVDADIREALETGKLAGYAADVLSQEPMPENHPLLGAPNTILTPHIAWAAKQTRMRLLQITADNLEAFLAGEAKNVVNS